MIGSSVGKRMTVQTSVGAGDVGVGGAGVGVKVLV
jgi:hypothetical protein